MVCIAAAPVKKWQGKTKLRGWVEWASLIAYVGLTLTGKQLFGAVLPQMRSCWAQIVPDGQLNWITGNYFLDNLAVYGFWRGLSGGFGKLHTALILGKLGLKAGRLAPRLPECYLSGLNQNITQLERITMCIFKAFKEFPFILVFFCLMPSVVYSHAILSKIHASALDSLQ